MNPYEKIGSVVEQWCKDHVYAQMLVTILIGYDWEPPHKETHLLDFDAEEGGLVWDSDWWEGQQHVELVGFTPLYKVKLEGEGEYARTVRHGFDTKESRYFHCSVCDYGASDVYEDGPTYCYEKQKEWSYCPNCGSDLREVQE